MSDCAIAIRNTVQAAYQDMDNAPKHYWCIFHVLKAFRTRAITYVINHLKEAIGDFRRLMFSRVRLDRLWDEFSVKWGRISPQFLNYVATQWYQNLERWAIFYRVVSNLLTT